MAFEHPGDGALDYMPCRYGASKMQFRGPKKELEAPYAAFFGATETYGRFIETPFPELLATRLGHTCVNLGCVNGGVDIYTHETELLNIASRARVTVVQVMGAHNLSNRFYSVHPRRNDRFIGPSALMKTLFRDVDFTDFAFTRHLMTTLQAHSPERFELVINELRAAWIARMRLLLQRIDGPRILLWLADHAPEDARIGKPGYCNDPLYVDRAMLEALDDCNEGLVEVVFTPSDWPEARQGMVFSELEKPAAMETPGPEVHLAATDALMPVLERYFQ